MSRSPTVSASGRSSSFKLGGRLFGRCRLRHRNAYLSFFQELNLSGLNGEDLSGDPPLWCKVVWEKLLAVEPQAEERRQALEVGKVI